MGSSSSSFPSACHLTRCSSIRRNPDRFGRKAKLMASIVDIHPHVISTDNKRFPLDPLGGKQSTWSIERPTPHEALVAAMKEAGVDKAAIVHASTAYGYDNSYVAEAVAKYPGRFTGVFSIDVLAPDAVE